MISVNINSLKQSSLSKQSNLLQRNIHLRIVLCCASWTLYPHLKTRYIFFKSAILCLPNSYIFRYTKNTTKRDEIRKKIVWSYNPFGFRVKMCSICLFLPEIQCGCATLHEKTFRTEMYALFYPFVLSFLHFLSCSLFLSFYLSFFLSIRPKSIRIMQQFGPNQIQELVCLSPCAHYHCIILVLLCVVLKR